MAINLGQISAISFGTTAPTNTRILWLADSELIPRYWDGAVWVPLNSTGPYSEYPDTDPTTIGNPPAGSIWFGWDDPDGFWYKDETGTIINLEELNHRFTTVLTVADRNALTDVKAQDRVTVTSDPDVTLNREYEAQVDNPLSTQWLAIPLANWQDTPIDGVPYVRLDRAWVEGVTKTALDISLDDYIKKDGSIPFDAPYIPINPQDAATKLYVDDGLALKEDYLGLPASNGLILSSDVAGNRSWVPQTIDTDTFIALTDTPLNYSGAANKWLRVNAGANGVFFDDLPPFVTDFLTLTDVTETTYAGSAGQVVTVNATETGLEFTTAAGFGNLLSDGSIPMDVGYTPAPGSQDIATANYVDAGLALKEDDLGNPTTDGDHLASTVAGVRSWVTPFSEAFLDLTDVIPSTYAGFNTYHVVVDGAGLNFQANPNPSNSFIELSDTPPDYTGSAGLFVRVNPTETGLEFSTEIGVGNLRSDGSIPMDAGWVPVLPEDLVDKKYVDSIVISGNLLSDGSVPMDAGWTPTNPQDLPTFQTVQDWAALIRITDTDTGWRLRTSNPANHLPIGEEAVDLSYSTTALIPTGAGGQYSVAMGEDTIAEGRSSMAVNRLSEAIGIFSFAGGEVAHALGHSSFAFGNGAPIRPIIAEGDFSAVLGGTSGQLGSLAENSVMLGGFEMDGNMPDMVYVPGVKWLPTTQPLAPEDGAMYYDNTLNQFLFWNESIPAWQGLSAGPPGSVTSFIGLPDTPLAYTGAAGQVPVVNTAEDALEFRPRAFGSVFVIPVGIALGFNIGDAVAYDGTGWIKADTSDELRAAQGIIQFADIAQSTVYISGEITWTGHGFTVGEWYWLDDTGAFVNPAPDQVLSQSIFFVKDANTIIVDVTRPQAKESFDNLLWTALGDTPGSYGGFVGHVPIVNSTEDGLVFSELPGLNRALGTFNYDNAVTPPPVVQSFSTDNVDLTLATTCSIDYTNLEGLDVTGYLNILAIGSYLSFVDVADPLNTILYQIDTLTDNVTYITYGITVIGVTGTITPGAVFALENIGAQIDAITQFIDMNDTPAAYAGEAGKLVAVNSAEDAVEFIDPLIASIVAIRYEFNATAGQTVITLAEAVDANMTLSINGLMISNTQYTTLGNDITLVTPLVVDDLIILTNYEPAQPVERFEQLATAGQTNFTLVNNVSGLAMVTCNGLVVSNTEYTSLANTLTFNIGRAVNDLIIITNYI